MCASPCGQLSNLVGKRAALPYLWRRLGFLFGQKRSCWAYVFTFAFAGSLYPLLPAAASLASRSEWAITTWETENGLPENSATAMAQDSDGYLWFGTFKGLVRFDGDRFTVFDHSTTPELPSDAIVNLHLDRSGRLWVSTFEGLVVKEGPSWRMVRTPQSREDFVRTFTDRVNGDLLLTTFHGQVLEYAKGQLSQLPAPPGDPVAGYFGGVDEDGRWWVAQDK